ncbi:MAG: NADH-quinone oxidoreductase subunit H [Candidatus Obscuribacterales bacterium]|nr:NADH-quinone oxidoreductase subunit H [Candidatus Obscuribacterales bacterium]
MISLVISWLNFFLAILLLPPLILSLIRKTKARLQNRVGPSWFQPIYDWSKLCRKDETLSSTLTWIFRGSAALNFILVLLLALFLPWISFKPSFTGDDIFLAIYVLALARFFSLLASLDSGSAFGGFAASREATLSLLVEPAFMLALVALGINARSSSLSAIFSYSTDANNQVVCFLAGTGILLSSLVELSRMPIDDPTTHLELTMVHEAMILEASGRNLLLVEVSYALKMTVLLGLSAQCFIHALQANIVCPKLLLVILSYLGILGLAALVGLIEGLTVKLHWRKDPEFIAYALTMSLLACFISIGQGATFK